LILYLDTSALVKLYVREDGSAPLRRRTATARALATSVVAYAEARAAFGRLRRSGMSSDSLHRRRVAQLDLDWNDWLRVELAQDVTRSAGELADNLAMRGFDAIHLASALWLSARTTESVEFAVWDARLAEAAVRAGLVVFPGLSSPGVSRG